MSMSHHHPSQCIAQPKQSSSKSLHLLMAPPLSSTIQRGVVGIKSSARQGVVTEKVMLIKVERRKSSVHLDIRVAQLWRRWKRSEKKVGDREILKT